MTDRVARLSTALEGRYSVVAEIGEGASATVYRGEDLKYHRAVAIKVLKPELATALGPERFLQEIEIASRLYHPNILPLFDSGEADGTLYYVTPYVTGDSLRERMGRQKQLPLEDALRIASDVALALAHAHAVGLIHRDVKPGNILLLNGRAIVADFGVARAITAAGGQRLTRTGIVVGTPVYMSPEQASGEEELDGRSDVYSLGCVLFEMLAGSPPFEGPIASVITARKLMEPPPHVTVLRDSVSAELDASLRKALARLPADRFQSAEELAESIERMRVVRPAREVQPMPARVRWGRSGIRIALVAALGVAMGLGVGHLASRTRPRTPTYARVRMTIPGASEVLGVAIAPDGSRIAWTFQGHTPLQSNLLVRRLDEDEVQGIPGAVAATFPFFSPDGAWLTFFEGGRLMKVASDGSSPVVLVDGLAGSRGASWGDDGELVYAPYGDPGLVSLRAQGGSPRRLTSPDSASGVVDYRFPTVLPGSRAILLTLFRDAPLVSTLGVARRDGGEVTDLGIEGTDASFLASTGHLLFADRGSLYAVPFDVRRLEVTGPRTRILDDIAVNALSGDAAYSIASDGTLVYRTVGDPAQQALVAVTRSGVVRPVSDDRRPFGEPRISPSGKRVVAAIGRGQRKDVWVYDLETAARTQVTHERQNMYPIWTPDGGAIIVSVGEVGTLGRDPSRRFFRIPADGVGEPRPFLDVGEALWEASLGPTEAWIVVRRTRTSENSDIGIASLHPPGAIRWILESPASERSPMVSPDGRWLAYTSDESGRNEVYVLALPEGQPRWRISADGGTEPLWRRDGREIFYRHGADLMAVPVEAGQTFRKGTPTRLFSDDRFATNLNHTDYDVYPDGDSLLMVLPEGEGRPGQLTVLVNFLEALLR
jgi:tRNA A-37 threonylcarbamoyl transferase component Bud32